MPAFKSAYLIHGDDHGRIAERRARLRALAEQQSGAQRRRAVRGGAGDARRGRDGAQRDDVRDRPAVHHRRRRRALEGQGPRRARGRARRRSRPTRRSRSSPARRAARRRPSASTMRSSKAGGDISAEQSIKPWELPKWVSARAQRARADARHRARRVRSSRHVGERQQRLLRELEKLALEFGPGATLDAITDRGADGAVGRAQGVVAGGRAAGRRRRRGDARLSHVACAGRARAGAALLDEPSGCARPTRSRAALDRGESPAQISRRLRMPPTGRRAADRRRRAAIGAEQPRATRSSTIADLELASRGGGQGGASEDTAALRAIQRDQPPEAASERYSARRRGARARRGTSCARRCCGAARRA